MDEADVQADRLLDIAVSLAEETGSWESVRLHVVAERAGLSLDRIHAVIREKEDLVERWFDRADRAMLKAAAEPNFQSLDSIGRLHCLIMTWLDTLATHRRMTRQMIVSKLEPGHLHVQIPAVLRVSRTVQWIREAAQRDAIFACRAIEEIGLTSIYLAAFTHWLVDPSPNSVATSRLLSRLLARAGWLARIVSGAQPVARRGAVV
jgi:ubiquinone biosynthesis protein COQ9